MGEIKRSARHGGRSEVWAALPYRILEVEEVYMRIYPFVPLALPR
jgi:hypothetical protein